MASRSVRDKSGRGQDLSQLKTPVLTSLSGTRQVIHALECGTGEVKQYLLDEINLMYECKTCLSVFRSLANLISHKRTFCKHKYKDVHHVYHDKPHRGDQNHNDVQTVIVESEPVECVVEPQDISLDNYAPSVELLKTSGILQDISNKPSVNRLLPPGKPSLGHIVNKLRAKVAGKDERFFTNQQRTTPPNTESPAETQVVHLEPMYETESGVMQSWRYSEQGETVGQAYRAWQEADKKCYKVWPNGKVTSTQETIKLVTGHDGNIYSVRVPVDDWADAEDIDQEEEEAGYTKYPCPTCKKTYSKIMNVFQHMVKVHDIEMREAKAKRKIIQNASIYVEGTKRKVKPKENFQRPVKPVVVRLKNFTLTAKPLLNLCDKLRQPWNSKTCPILSTNCLSDTSNHETRDMERAQELHPSSAQENEEPEEQDNHDDKKLNGEVENDDRESEDDDQPPPLINLQDEAEVSFKQKVSPDSSSSVSPRPVTPETVGGKRKRSRPRKNSSASHSLKRSRQGSGDTNDDETHQNDRNDNKSLKLVFSNMSSISPSVSPTPSSESKDSDISNSRYN